MTAISWIMSTRIGRWLAMIGTGLALLAGAVLVGWSKRGQVEAGKDAEDYIETREELDDEDYLDPDINSARDRLRKFGES